MMPEDPTDARWLEDDAVTDLPDSQSSRSETDRRRTERRAIHPVVPPPKISAENVVEIQRIDKSRRTEVATLPTSTAKQPTQPNPTPRQQPSPKPTASQKNSVTHRRPDPILQSLMLLVTMACMLAAARYAVPSIVEEIRFAWHRGELRAEYETGTDGLKNVSLDTLSQAYQMVTSVVGPSVVHIEVERRSQSGQSEVNRLLSAQMMPAADQGSGAIVDEAGYIVTNRHVIADGEDITVTLSDGRQVGATIVGTDALTDMAVLKVDATGLIPIKWGDSDRCRVGSPVWAVGSPFGFDRSVTFGILSGKHRMVRASTRYQDFMQSDVAVNPGNSGGPLVDARGQMIGINTAIVGDTYQGVSFSIPSSVAKQVYEQLISTGRVDRGWLGVSLAEVPDDLFVGENHRMRGALVGGLADSRSPAALAGVLPGDIITAVDGVDIRDMSHLMRIIGNAIVGSEVELSVRRKESAKATTIKKLRVRLNARPTELSP
ncbi:MAG: trypsin-like peptidase domain-containing protein [Pirellulaceae bacterium]